MAWLGKLLFSENLVARWKYYVDQVHYIPQWSPLAPSYKPFLSTIIKL